MNTKLISFFLFLSFISLTIVSCTEVSNSDLPQSAPQSAPQSGSVTLLDDRGNTVSLETIDNNQTIVQVFSEDGWGNADINLSSEIYPSQITLRFHLSGLEQLTMEYGDSTHLLSLSSSGDFDVRQTMTNAAGSSEIAESSSDWAPAGSVESNGTSVEYIDITMPASFVEQQIRNFSIQWVDFYR